MTIRRFLLSGVALSVAILGTCWVLLVIPIPGTPVPVNPATGYKAATYMAATIDKHRLLETTGQAAARRLILVGGSNLAFGVDSPALEIALGMKVINMGLHANVGLRNMLNEVKLYLKDSDSVLICPEYEQFYGALSDGNGPLLKELCQIYPAWKKYLTNRHTLTEIAPTLRALLDRVQTKFASLVRFLLSNASRSAASVPKEPAPPEVEDPSCIYCRAAFNEWGDVTRHLTAEGVDISTADLLADTRFNWHAVQVLNSFAAYAQARGASALFAFPCVPRPQYTQKREVIEELSATLRETLQMAILCTPEQLVLPVACFFDTVYHLNAQGMNARMKILIDVLAEALHEDHPGDSPPTQDK